MVLEEPDQEAVLKPGPGTQYLGAQWLTTLWGDSTGH